MWLFRRNKPRTFIKALEDQIFLRLACENDPSAWQFYQESDNSAELIIPTQNGYSLGIRVGAHTVDIDCLLIIIDLTETVYVSRTERWLNRSDATIFSTVVSLNDRRRLKSLRKQCLEIIVDHVEQVVNETYLNYLLYDKGFTN